MSSLPSFVELKAIHRLSGDHRPHAPPKDVNCTGLRPSLSQTQISSFPERVELNRIDLPSGECLGAASICLDAMNLSGGLPVAAELGPGIRQMLKCATSRA